MLSAVHECEDLSLERRPLVEDSARAGMQHEGTSRDQLGVSSPVSLPSFWGRVPTVAVQLDHESVADHQIDTSDARDDDLRPRDDAA
ncbi:hypothetical protein GCM10027515_17630 [Schumannella luteola]